MFCVCVLVLCMCALRSYCLIYESQTPLDSIFGPTKKLQNPKLSACKVKSTFCLHRKLDSAFDHDRVFENKFKFDLTNERALRKHLTEDIVKELQGSAEIVTG